jgi:type II secretory pathway component GspD/PulD (secretin)
VRLQFIKNKNQRYFILVLAFFIMAFYIGCASSTKESKSYKKTEVKQKEEVKVDESKGVEVQDVEPMEDLTTSQTEEIVTQKNETSKEMTDLDEIPAVSYEEDILQERVVIDVENTPLHDVIQTLVKGRGFNLILPEKLMGIVSADFEDITLQEAFDQLLTTYGYTWRLDGNFLKIMKGEPIWIWKVKFLPISQMNEEISLGGRGQQGRINSDVGKVLQELEIIKGPQGRLFVNEWVGTITGIGLDPSVIPYLEEYLRFVDVKRKQVLIEATIVKVQLEDQYSAGIDWDMAMSGKDYVPWDNGRFLSLKGWSDLVAKGFITRGQAAIGVSNDHIQAVLNAFAKQGKVNVLSSPKALTVDGRSAYMRVEQEVAYTEDTVSYPGGGQSAFVTTSTQTKRPNLEFSVIPRVSDDGYIMLNVFMNAEEVYATSTEKAVPLISRREMNTIARAQNGQTIVVGGLIQETVSEEVKKVPFFGDIPLIGGLFRNTNQAKVKTELVIFVTPHLLDDAKLNQFTEDDRISIKDMQETNVKGQSPLFK